MTLAAREVLEDCKFALGRLSSNAQGREWRVCWINVVTLLRAVGHVLKNVDEKRDEESRKIIQSVWSVVESKKPQPAIFWEFIKKHRDEVLKTYKFQAGQGALVSVDGASTTVVYSYPITSGFFSGRDQRGLVEEAVIWWEGVLQEIEEALSQNSG